MEMQQIVEMLAKLQASQDADREERKADQEKMAADLLARMKEDRKADQEDFLERMDKMYAKMAKADKQEEMLTDINAKTKARRDKRMEANSNDDRNEWTACQDVMEANPEKMESNLKEKEAVVQRQDIPIENVAMMPVGEPRKRRRGGKLIAGRRGKPKKLNRRNCGSRKKLAAACRKVSRYATVAWRKRKLFRKSETRGYCGSRKCATVADRRTCPHATMAWRKRKLTRNIRIQESRESSKDFSVNGMRKGPGCKNCIRRRNIKEPPHLRTERKIASSIGGEHKREQRRLKGMSKYKDIYWRTIGLDFVKQVVRMSRGFLQMTIWRLWRGRPPPKRKKKSCMY
jgi:hypothetical protein